MTDDTIRRAMRGDGEVARECTEAGEALPCPHCGHTGITIKSIGHPIWWGCSECSADGPPAQNKQTALAYWNTRVSLPEEPREALTGWINCRERMPEETDADHLGYILAYSASMNQSTVCPWYHIIGDGVTTHWMKMPEPPPQEGDAHG